MLLDHGARPNLPDKEGRTALMLAAVHGKTEIAALLCARGADLGLRDSRGKSALELAVEEVFPETAALLLAKDPAAAAAGEALRRARDHALLRAIRAGDAQGAGELLAQGADANTADDEGRPALGIAAANTVARGWCGFCWVKA